MEPAKGHRAHKKGIYASNCFSCPWAHSSPICFVLTWLPESSNQHLLCALGGGHTEQPRLEHMPARILSIYPKDTYACKSPLRAQVLRVKARWGPWTLESKKQLLVCSLPQTTLKWPLSLPICDAEEITFRSQHNETDRSALGNQMLNLILHILSLNYKWNTF